MVQVPSLVPSDEKYRWFLFGFAHFSLILINISYFKLLALNYLPRYLVAVHIHNLDEFSWRGVCTFNPVEFRKFLSKLHLEFLGSRVS